MHHGEPVDLSVFACWVQVDVRYSDLDTQGHVNNGTYFVYLEQARMAFLHDLRSYNPEREAGNANATGLTFVVGSASCVYRSSIRSAAPLHVGIRCSRIGRASFDLEYAICDQPGGHLYASGTTTHVCIHPETRRPRTLPDWARAMLQPESTHATAS